MSPTKSPRLRATWLVALLVVIFLPVLFYVFAGGRAQTSITDRLLSITGAQSAGLLLYTVALATRFKSKTSEFGVPLHRWVGLALLSFVLGHIVLAVLSNPENVRLLLFWDAPARGAAATGALICWVLVIMLGEFRKRIGIKPALWRPTHVILAWLGAILALAHILWIDQLVNSGLWLLLFAGIALTAFYLWWTRAKGVNKTTEGAVPRIVKVILLTGAFMAISVTVLAWRVPDALSVGYTQHQLGPIGPADRDMLYKVKQAGLWEMPVGQEAVSRATTRELREIGQKISDEHHVLDQRVTEVAASLGIPLPNEASPDQQRWMREITASQGADYDRNAVFLLRQAHGKVLPVLAQVRVGSRNQVIRDFASESIEYVHRHVGYLEGTGLVNFSQLPESPTPSPYQQPVEASYFDSHDTRTLSIAFLVIAVLCVLLAMIVHSMLRTPSPARKPKSVAKHRKA